MDRGTVPPLRSLPRCFVLGLEPDEEVIELPTEEIDKFRKVLRLGTGDEVAVLPNDGVSVWRCRLDGRRAVVEERVQESNEAQNPVILAQALPKPDKLDEVVRMGTEMGVQEFWLFPTERTVVRWDAKKTEDRIRRLEKIAREAAEVSFRTRLPRIKLLKGLDEALEHAGPEVLVLSELETVPKSLADALPPAGVPVVLVIGPEGGWSRAEVKKIGNLGVTLGPRVLRVDTAAACAVALAIQRK